MIKRAGFDLILLSKNNKEGLVYNIYLDIYIYSYRERIWNLFFAINLKRNIDIAGTDKLQRQRFVMSIYRGGGERERGCFVHADLSDEEKGMIFTCIHRVRTDIYSLLAKVNYVLRLSLSLSKTCGIHCGVFFRVWRWHRKRAPNFTLLTILFIAYATTHGLIILF